MEENDLKQVIEWMDDLYQFVLLSIDNMKKPHDYGTGDILNMVEMHTLAMIAETPGLCVTDVARLWSRTLSAASRNVDRLQKKGYIEKRKLNGNEKAVHLYATGKGQSLAQLHKAHDAQSIQRNAKQMLEKHSMEDIATFFAVLHSLYEIISSDEMEGKEETVL